MTDDDYDNGDRWVATMRTIQVGMMMIQWATAEPVNVRHEHQRKMGACLTFIGINNGKAGGGSLHFSFRSEPVGNGRAGKC